MPDDTLDSMLDAAVAEQTTALELAEFGALTAMSSLEVAEERLASAVQTLQRTSAALRVLRGLGPAPVIQGAANAAAAGAVQAAAQTSHVLPVDTTKPPDMGSTASDRAPNPASAGIMCPGCGDHGTIVRIDGYKGTPYSVLQCTSCNWERNV